MWQSDGQGQKCAGPMCLVGDGVRCQSVFPLERPDTVRTRGRQQASKVGILSVCTSAGRSKTQQRRQNDLKDAGRCSCFEEDEDETGEDGVLKLCSRATVTMVCTARILGVFETVYLTVEPELSGHAMAEDRLRDRSHSRRRK